MEARAKAVAGLAGPKPARKPLWPLKLRDVRGLLPAPRPSLPRCKLISALQSLRNFRPRPNANRPVAASADTKVSQLKRHG